jgi:hypothetical protein
MTSPAVDSKLGKPDVQGSVAGRVTQPAGCEIENPKRSEVNVSVNAGDAARESLGEALGGGKREGLAVGWPPTSGEVPGRSMAIPTAPIAITATAATADLA